VIAGVRNASTMRFSSTAERSTMPSQSPDPFHIVRQREEVLAK
jgi:hypothetical protein